jgi:hypothetical protein
MARKRRPGRFTWKEDRELIAMAASGATVSELAAKFRTTVETIERKAKTLGIRIKGHGRKIGLKARK